MAIRQLSVFAENKNGSLYRITKVLADAGVDIRAFSVADTERFGVLRLIVNDTHKAARVLSEAGEVVDVSEVLGVKIPDTPGGLSELLRIVTEDNISVEYLYAFVSREGGNAYVVLRVEDNATVEALFAKEGCALLTEEELH